MTKCVAFLRGMNVGGRRLTNATLVQAFEDLGFSGVSAFRASGNVLFDAVDGDVVLRVERGLHEALGYEVPTLVRTGEQVARIASFDGLPARGPDGGKLQVALLRDPPEDAAREAVLALATSDDQLAFGACELYWLPRAGISVSDLDWRAIERLVGGNTVRTVGTVTSIAKRCG